MGKIMQTTAEHFNIHYAKTHLSRLIDEVANTGKPITIAKAGTPKVMIVPITHTKAKRQMGTLKGKISIPDNFDSAFADEIADMFAGE
ncbi:type II toxin-antitoxin system Phd/YefM family antitoxin [Moraxella lacunata]|uniref:type II toxin-antitoxin system Phd/YefM family antitoxin n=1 Tax=Moraxella lacunata TaxID=477 RepID=UPI003EE3C037